MKKRWLSYAIAAVPALAIALLCVCFEAGDRGISPALRIQYLSDGFFLSAVLFLGCGMLICIADAGNFYGIQFLGYTLVRMFSPSKERFGARKDYFTYCTEKQAKQKEKGPPGAKWVMIHVGLGCLVLSLVFAFVFYRV